MKKKPSEYLPPSLKNFELPINVDLSGYESKESSNKPFRAAIQPKGPGAWLLYINERKELMAHVIDFGDGKELGYLVSAHHVETNVTHYDYQGRTELITLGVDDTLGSTLDLLLNKSEYRGFLDRSIKEPDFIHVSDPRFLDYAPFIAKLLSVDLATYQFMKVDYIYVTNKLESQPSAKQNHETSESNEQRSLDADAQGVARQSTRQLR